MDKIIVIADCNNFYVSCERLFDPRLSHVPTVVLTNNDGSVISRSAEAKSLGIRKGENFYGMRDLVREKKIRCYSSNYTLYADISERVFSVIKKYSPFVEIYSIDEVFFDISHIQKDQVVNYLKGIKKEVYKRTGIPISLGAASNKTLAKLANKISKETDGAFYMSDPKKFIAENEHRFEFDDIWGIGDKGKEKIINLGCKTLSDFINYSPTVIKKVLTVTGLRTQMELGGTRCFEVETTFKERKNISTSRTFGSTISDFDALQKATHFYVQKAVLKLKREGMMAQTFLLFVCNDKYKDSFYYSELFKVKLIRATQDESEIWSQVQNVLLKIYKPEIKYRKSGVCLSDLVPLGRSQSLLFQDLTRPMSYEEPEGNAWRMRRNYLSKKYTSNWNEIPTVSRIEDF